MTHSYDEPTCPLLKPIWQHVAILRGACRDEDDAEKLGAILEIIDKAEHRWQMSDFDEALSQHLARHDALYGSEVQEGSAIVALVRLVPAVEKFMALHGWTVKDGGDDLETLLAHAKTLLPETEETETIKPDEYLCWADGEKEICGALIKAGDADWAAEEYAEEFMEDHADQYTIHTRDHKGKKKTWLVDVVMEPDFRARKA